MAKPRYKDRVGEKYGRLTVIEFAGRNEASRKQKTVLWKCDCDCGTRSHVVHARNLASGRVKSCGCLAVEQSRRAGVSRALPGKQSAVFFSNSVFVSRLGHNFLL